MQSKIQNPKSKISLRPSVFSVVKIFVPILLCLLCGGCANQPPNRNALSGIRLRVTMRYNYIVNPNYQYYFCINNAGDRNAAGPIPVGAPLSNQTYGNGFATASDNGASGTTNKGGFTDFVLWSAVNPYGGASQNNYALYHVIGDANDRNTFRSSGVPISSVAPSTDPTDPAGATTLTFELDLSQLIRDATGGAVDANTAANTARALQYLQVNIIATNTNPLAQSPAIKAYDSMGDTSNGRGSYLTLDVRQGRIVSSTDVDLPETNEPTFYDVYGGTGLSPLDLTSWSIEVVRTN